MIYVVRHAKAGHRVDDPAENYARPLSKAGRAQAKALGERLSRVDPPQLLSSHFPRCVQTLQPLAERLGQKVIVDDRLAEGAPLVQVLELVATAPDNTVMCSHGDVIPDLIDALHRRGAHLTTDPDWRKASMWVLTRENGKITALAAEPPPKIDD